METITFIGNGNMALSIAHGLKNTFKIEVVGRDISNLDKFEKDVLLLLNGTNTLQSISAIVNNNSELDPKKCHSKVLKVIQSFMEFNYVEACSDLSYV